MIDFASMPPEINSTRMYTGPGPASFISAAAAWEAVAAGLISAAGGMSAVTAGLVGSAWSGPSSAMMGMSATQFVAWVFQTAARAEMTAAAAMGVADAHATAFTATIPPPEVERNQATTAALIASNFLGVNSAAIAASQAQYEEYWAQDASAMLTYAAANQTLATSLNAPPFLPAIPNTDPAGLASQAAAVGEAAGTDAGQASSTVGGATSNLGGMSSAMGGAGSLVSTPAQMMTAIPQMLGQLASPLSSAMSGMFGNGGGMTAFTGFSGYSPAPTMASPSVSASMGRGMGLFNAAEAQGGRPNGLSVPASWPGAQARESTTTAKEVSATALTEEEGTSTMAAPRAGMMPAAMGGNSSSGGVSTISKRSTRPRVVPHYP